MSRKKKSLLFVFALILVFCLAACSEKAENDADKTATNDNEQTIQTVENGKLRVAMECGYAPFNWTQTDDSNGAVAISGEKTFANGYDVQMAKKVAESLGLELEIVKLVWDSLPPAVQSGNVDLIMAGMSPTKERKEVIDFADAYYRSDLVIVLKKDNPYASARSIKDFKDAKITAQLNTFHYSVIDQIEGVKKQEPMEDFPVMRVALSSGAIDGYVSERPEGISASAALKDFTYVEFDEGEGFKYSADDVSIAPGMKKGNPTLLEAVNRALGEISEEARLTLMEEMIKIQPSNL
jgi:ABC-type amino acid transport substrate-binding protein